MVAVVVFLVVDFHLCKTVSLCAVVAGAVVCCSKRYYCNVYLDLDLSLSL